MNFTELKAKKEDLTKKLYSLKTKKAKEKVRNQLNEINSQLWDIYDVEAGKFRNKKFTGIITNVFSDGALWIEVDGIGTVSGSICNAVNTKSWYPNTCCMIFEKGQQIELEFYIETSSNGIKLIPTKIVGGIVDEEKYAKLKQNPNLAFFKYDDDNMSGLLK